MKMCGVELRSAASDRRRDTKNKRGRDRGESSSNHTSNNEVDVQTIYRRCQKPDRSRSLSKKRRKQNVEQRKENDASSCRRSTGQKRARSRDKNRKVKKKTKPTSRRRICSRDCKKRTRRTKSFSSSSSQLDIESDHSESIISKKKKKHRCGGRDTTSLQKPAVCSLPASKFSAEENFVSGLKNSSSISKTGEEVRTTVISQVFFIKKQRCLGYYQP